MKASSSWCWASGLARCRIGAPSSQYLCLVEGMGLLNAGQGKGGEEAELGRERWTKGRIRRGQGQGQRLLPNPLETWSLAQAPSVWCQLSS